MSGTPVQVGGEGVGGGKIVGGGKKSYLIG